MKIAIIAGARPNFIKVAPIIKEIELKKSLGFDIDFRLIHTGQHYDRNMSALFFEQLNIPAPHINLNCGGGSQAEITSSIMLKFEKELINNPANLVLVVGDVTSTMACTIVSRKLHIKVAHVEAGIRSYDWEMPEEINRLVTDRISNYFFTTSVNAGDNLIKEGVDKKDIFFVGNTMIDSLIKNQNRFQKPEFWQTFKLKSKNYFVITLHRPSNVDEHEKLKLIVEKIISSSKDYPIVFPMHPRTKNIFNSLKISSDRLFVVPPLSYLEFNFLVKNSKLVITDSGGVTEETTVLGIPCITLRNSTERPETVTEGTNELIGTDPNNIPVFLEKLFSGNWKKGKIPKLWDGNTSKRIVDVIIEKININEK